MSETPVSETTLCDSICLQLAIPGHEAAVELLHLLGNTETEFQVQSVMETASSEQTVVPVNVDALTAKQREVVLLALEHGYYETPRRTTLDELANKLDISSSAASQRLNAAERTLIRETFGRFVQK